MRDPLPSSGALVGSHLGRYRLDALIGDGGMGEVYRAFDLDAGRNVAVKVLGLERSRDPAMRTRFEREWRVMRDIAHPNVVALLDWPDARGGPPHFVLELLHGETLHERLEREETVEPLEALDTFA